MYVGMQIGLNEALLVTVFSMAVVFATLFIIAWSLDLFKHLSKGEEAPAKKTAAAKPATAPAVPQEDENIQVAIMAAVAEYERRKRSNSIARNVNK